VLFRSLGFIPKERIGWDATAVGIDAYHAFVIQPAPRGCTVVPEDAQHGWLARLSHLLNPNRMHEFHRIWLQELERNAVAGFPPAGSSEMADQLASGFKRPNLISENKGESYDHWCARNYLQQKP
jgi:hypothetical protein